MRAFEAWSSAYFNWTVRHPLIVVAVALLAVLACALGLRHLSFDPDSRVFFGQDNPQKLALDRMERTFSAANTVVFVVAAKQGSILTARGLTLIEELTARAWRTPYSSRVDSLSNVQTSRARGDEIVFEPYFKNAARLGEDDIRRVARAILGDKELVHRLVSPNGDTTAVVVFVVQPRQSRQEIRDIAEFSRALAAEFAARYPEFELRLTGGVPADVTFAEAGSSDFVTLIPVMMGLIVAALWIGLRSATGVFATGMVVAGAVVVTLGLFIGTGTTLNGATSSAPLIIMTICILDAAHVITTMSQNIAAGQEKKQALVNSLKSNNLAMFITSLTDVIGFVVLNFADSPPLNELGNMVSVGAAAGYVLSISLLPALLVLLPMRPRGGKDRLGRAMRFFADLAVAHRVKLLVGMALLGAVTSAGIVRITLDDDFVKYFDERFAFRRDTDFYQQRLGGLHVVNFALPAEGEHGITEPSYLRNLDRFAAWFRTQPKVVHVVAFSDVMKRLNMNLNGDDPKHYVVGESRRLNAQLLLLYELSVPSGRDLRSQIDVAKSSTLFSVIVRDASSADIQALAAAGEAWLAREAPAMRAVGTGLSVAYAHISEANIRMMLLGTFVGLSLISLTMFFVLGTARLALLSLVPNLIPATMAYGLWGYFVGEVNLAVSVVGSFTFGIIVDDTVHFISKYIHARRALGHCPEDAARYSFQVAGVPTIIASIVLISGFVVLCFSGFAISRQMGMLSAITIVLGLLVELFLLPSLLLVFGERRRKAG